MSFMLNKMEEKAGKCWLWSKKEITEIIKEVFPDQSDKDKVKDLLVKLAFATKPMVCMCDYFHFLH